MASILKTLLSFFAGTRRPTNADSAAVSIEYKGFVIRAKPFMEGGQYQTAGVITKEIEGVTKQHQFIRADRYAALDDAIAFALAKGRQIIDEQERLPQRRSLFDD